MNRENKSEATAFVESFHREDFYIEQARAHGAESAIANPSPATASFIAQIAATIGAKSVVEIGTGTGVGALWVFSLTGNSAVITSIDTDREAASITRSVLEEVGINAARYRLITGNVLDVVNKLADQNYDLIIIRLVDDLLDVIAESHRLLKENGVLILDNALGGGKTPEPTARDVATISRRDAIKALKDQDRWRSTMVEVGDGVVWAVKE
jgi:predicted O-methyltransferase YrrM